MQIGWAAAKPQIKFNSKVWINAISLTSCDTLASSTVENLFHTSLYMYVRCFGMIRTYMLQKIWKANHKLVLLMKHGKCCIKSKTLVIFEWKHLAGSTMLVQGVYNCRDQQIKTCSLPQAAEVDKAFFLPHEKPAVFVETWGHLWDCIELKTQEVIIHS